MIGHVLFGYCQGNISEYSRLTGKPGFVRDRVGHFQQLPFLVGHGAKVFVTFFDVNLTGSADTIGAAVVVDIDIMIERGFEDGRAFINLDFSVIVSEMNIGHSHHIPVWFYRHKPGGLFIVPIIDL